MDDKLTQREKISLLISVGPWFIVLVLAATWVRLPGSFTWELFVVWFFLLIVAIIFTMPAMPKRP